MKYSLQCGLGVIAVLLLQGWPDAVWACDGDCDGDGAVSVDEIVRGVGIALESIALETCAPADMDGDGRVSVDEIIAAVRAALVGCPHPPMLPPFGLYRTYPDQPIRVSLAASAAAGGVLQYTAHSIPAGAELDFMSGLFTWTPTEQQLGPFYVGVTVSDDGAPQLTDTQLLTFKVSPPDWCSRLTCDPAIGCESALIALTQSCCAMAPTTRVAEPVAGCPAGRIVFVGRNQDSGFGRLQNCDRFPVINFAQIGAIVRFNLEARCVNRAPNVTVHARLETATRLLFDAQQQASLHPAPDGFARRFNLAFPVRGPGPFFEFEGAEAEMNVSVTDADGVTLTEQLRLVLTFAKLDDLVDIPAPPPPH